MNEKFYGNYLGIVVRTDDPDSRGRVKVFVPHLSATLYDRWNAIPEDKLFNFPGENTSPDLQNILNTLNQVLPWAEPAGPLLGGGSQGSYNALGSAGTVSDGNFTDLPIVASNTGSEFVGPVGKIALDTDGRNPPPFQDARSKKGPGYQPRTSLPGLDANVDNYIVVPSNSPIPLKTQVLVQDETTGKHTLAIVGDHGDNNSYGEMSLATAREIGAWHDGLGNSILDHKVTYTYNPTASAIAAADAVKPAQNIADARSHDGHNDSAQNSTLKANPHTNEYTAPPYSNVAKGTFSIPNVGAHVWCFFEGGDHMKPVVFASAYGSSDFSSALQAGSDTSDSKYTSSENGGDRYRALTVINPNRGGTIEIVGTEGRELLSLISYFGHNVRMSKNGISSFSAHNDQKLINNDQFLTVNNDRSVVIRNHNDLNVYGDNIRKIGHINSYLEVYKQIIDKVKPTHNKIALFESKRSPMATRGSTSQSQSGTSAPCPVCSPGETYSSRSCEPDTFNLNGMSNSQTLLAETSPSLTAGSTQIKTGTFGTTGMIFGKTCLACGGSGKSPSSEMGNWAKDSDKEQAAKDMVSQINELADLEAKLGPGGSEIVTIAKDYVITVGLQINDMEAVRTDPKGKMVPNGIKIATGGAYKETSEVPIMEIIPPHPAFPGGNFDLTVMNRYNLLCGSGGIFFKTKGVVQLAGTVMNLNADQILITSINEVKITAGKSFSVDAENISLKPANQVIVNGGLAVAKNAIIAGGLHVEGELSLHHITAPLEYQLTELESPGGTTVASKIVGYVHNVSPGGSTLPVMGSAIPDCIVVDAHKHYFKNLPLTLLPTNDNVRDAAVPNNDSAVNVAAGKTVASY